MSSTYEIGAWITFFVVFVGCWIYCIAAYGFLFGVGLGWLPAGICAAIAAVAWPLLATAIAVLAIYLMK